MNKLKFITAASLIAMLLTNTVELWAEDDMSTYDAPATSNDSSTTTIGDVTILGELYDAYYPGTPLAGGTNEAGVKAFFNKDGNYNAKGGLPIIGDSANGFLAVSHVPKIDFGEHDVTRGHEMLLDVLYEPVYDTADDGQELLGYVLPFFQIADTRRDSGDYSFSVEMGENGVYRKDDVADKIPNVSIEFRGFGVSATGDSSYASFYAGDLGTKVLTGALVGANPSFTTAIASVPEVFGDLDTAAYAATDTVDNELIALIDNDGIFDTRGRYISYVFGKDLTARAESFAGDSILTTQSSESDPIPTTNGIQLRIPAASTGFIKADKYKIDLVWTLRATE
ncbi:MAG: WxL domain-containing protein [Lactobacillales bacterium]|jgi:hypothetical protein|nr:WxL domain-containing protein [Lactobacillales bacterium]